MGDRVRVHFQVVEGTRRRTQVFEGVVLKQQGAGAARTFTVRKLSFGVGVERTFPVHSPKIERIEVMARGEVRRAKLYYLRGRVGRRARLRERRDFRPEEVGMLAGRRRRSRRRRSGETAQPRPPAAETAEARRRRGGGGARRRQRPRRRRPKRGREPRTPQAAPSAAAETEPQPDRPRVPTRGMRRPRREQQPA